jgi:hypothetical protein
MKQAMEAVYSDIIHCQHHKLKQIGFFIIPKEIQEVLFLGKMRKLFLDFSICLLLQ